MNGYDPATAKMRSGYQLIFNGEALPGLSGSPILDEYSQLIGVYGCYESEGNTFTASLYGIPIDTAKSFFAQASLKLDSNYAKSYTSRGIFRAHGNDLNGAISDYSKAIELDSSYAKAYYNRGIAYRKANQLDKAEVDLSSAIQINPRDAEFLFERGAVYLGLKRVDEAIKDFSTAIEINPTYADAYYNRGLGYTSKKDPRLAAENFQKAADLYQRQGNTQGAANARDRLRKTPTK